MQAIEQLTVTTLRNVIGGLTLEQTLTSRENVNSELRVVLDEATGKWGIRINRVEIKSVAEIAPIHKAQLLSYLKLSGKPLGLLLNFNVVRMRDGIVRMRNG